jgi:hypothetical protein
MKAWLAAAGLAVLIGCSNNSSPPAKSSASAGATNSLDNNSSGNPITAPVDYLGAVAKAKKRGASVADLAPLRQAIQVFKTEEERYPKDLKELVTKQYMPAIPAPPYQMKYEYNAANGNVSLVPAPAQ